MQDITIELATELVAFIDEQVSAGRAAGRPEVVLIALHRQRQRVLAERDTDDPQ